MFCYGVHCSLQMTSAEQLYPVLNDNKSRNGHCCLVMLHSGELQCTELALYSAAHRWCGSFTTTLFHLDYRPYLQKTSGRTKLKSSRLTKYAPQQKQILRLTYAILQVLGSPPVPGGDYTLDLQSLLFSATSQGEKQTNKKTHCCYTCL